MGGNQKLLCSNATVVMTFFVPSSMPFSQSTNFCTHPTIILMAGTGSTWDDLQQSIIDSGGAAQQMADTQLDNLQGQITILKSALEGSPRG